MLIALACRVIPAVTTPVYPPSSVLLLELDALAALLYRYSSPVTPACASLQWRTCPHLCMIAPMRAAALRPQQHRMGRSTCSTWLPHLACNPLFSLLNPPRRGRPRPTPSGASRTCSSHSPRSTVRPAGAKSKRAAGGYCRNGNVPSSDSSELQSSNTGTFEKPMRGYESRANGARSIFAGSSGTVDSGDSVTVESGDETCTGSASGGGVGVGAISCASSARIWARSVEFSSAVLSSVARRDSFWASASASDDSSSCSYSLALKRDT
eukprot:IDg11041t1